MPPARSLIPALLALPLLCAGVPACAPVPMGGEGETRRGEPLAAEARLGFDGRNEVIINSARGWSCSGTYDRRAAANSTTRRFALACTSGARGTAVMAVNSVQQRATVVFSLSDGTSGRVAFGLVG